MGKRVSDAGGVIPVVFNRVELFASQSEDTKVKLCTAAELWEFSKGEIVTQAVDPVEAVIVLVRGTFLNERIYANGKRMVTAVLAPGWPLKVPAVWNGSGSPFGLTARTDAIAIQIPRQAFLSIVNGDVEFLRDVTTFIGRQYQQDTTNLQVRTMSSLGCQLALLLAFHAQSAVHLRHDTEQGTDIEALDVTQEEFAAMLGCSRQKVNGLMKEMEQAGILQRHGRLVEIIDFMRLLEWIEEDEPAHPNFRKVFESWHAHVAAAKKPSEVD